MQPEDSIRLSCYGPTGQSFGAFLARGVTLDLEGDANDYVGKGLSGGKIIIKPADYNPSFVPEENVICGNVCFYGASSGEAYIRGIASQRFCVRNSGVLAVVEGCGDHGCEYMTGGRVVVLGSTGVNFAAGMSGGIAYIYDPGRMFPDRCNHELVSLEGLQDAAEIEWLQQVITEHKANTGSTMAAKVLDDWEDEIGNFVKVFPHDYKGVLQKRAEGAEISLSEVIVKSITAGDGSALDKMIELRMAAASQ
eukprot:SAG11_NODE_400_length_9761_cov_5.916373_2_plen_251_part_00